MAEPKKVLKWLGIGCGTLVLLAGLGIGGCLLFIKGVTDAPADGSHRFLASLRSNDLSTAHALMSPEYQASHPLPAFQQSVGQLPALVSHTDATLSSRSVNNGHATMSGFLTTPSGNAPVTVMLSIRGEVWYIDSVMVMGQPLR